MNRSQKIPSVEIAEALEVIPDSRIAEVLLEGMSATVTNRSGVTEADTRTRIQSAALALSYKVGRPSVAIPPPVQKSAEESSEERIIEKMVFSEAYFKAMEGCWLRILDTARARRAEQAALKK